MGKTLKNNSNPKYIGVKLYTSLTFRQHFTETAAEILTRTNIIQKLVKSSWSIYTRDVSSFLWCILWQSITALFGLNRYCIG